MFASPATSCMCRKRGFCRTAGRASFILRCAFGTRHTGGLCGDRLHKRQHQLALRCLTCRPLWGNPELLDRSNAFYFDLLPNATSLARFQVQLGWFDCPESMFTCNPQGYKGARWLKMLGLANTYFPYTSIDVKWLGTDYVCRQSGKIFSYLLKSAYFPAQATPPDWAPAGQLLLWESFNKINPVLQWNQPHMVWLADVQVSVCTELWRMAPAHRLVSDLRV